MEHMLQRIIYVTFNLNPKLNVIGGNINTATSFMNKV